MNDITKIVLGEYLGKALSHIHHQITVCSELIKKDIHQEYFLKTRTEYEESEKEIREILNAR